MGIDLPSQLCLVQRLRNGVIPATAPFFCSRGRNHSRLGHHVGLLPGVASLPLVHAEVSQVITDELFLLDR